MSNQLRLNRQTGAWPRLKDRLKMPRQAFNLRLSCIRDSD